MKLVLICTALTIGLAAPVAAQTGAPASPAPAMAAPAFTADTPIEQLVSNPATKAVLEADFPGLTTHPAYEQFKAMSLKQLAPYSNGVITDDKLAKVSADLAAVK